mmetsp:Transcript_39513/g.87916  ORF Transcript_39513/g.87916 Transcript_39513/m.87916 type:complete len:253 (+) Transcript_39513:1096-1854(+)
MLLLLEAASPGGALAPGGSGPAAGRGPAAAGSSSPPAVLASSGPALAPSRRFNIDTKILISLSRCATCSRSLRICSWASADSSPPPGAPAPAAPGVPAALPLTVDPPRDLRAPPLRTISLRMLSEARIIIMLPPRPSSESGAGSVHHDSICVRSLCSSSGVSGPRSSSSPLSRRSSSLRPRTSALRRRMMLLGSISSFRSTWFLTSATLMANLHVEILSSSWFCSLLMVATMTVRQLPPRLSLRAVVIMLLR